ncbi:Rossmann-like and DUF2520 domain-containing protein [Tenacibaculum finnmarkense]|uniref:DUF2520 domain-containing protein n=1 Tax=Tenacibaculum finnmarkense genomovar finnmarkense TaxID=1458503 RepID=A0AAP1WG64_9FLAO|nr:DUF2520 domain-containing protein [Tenacibaculum finnmarkense]MBE7652661.1 DUF2520 domain-containing protein [Tenacibaculum finnmarkense genomovar finnmarkense]MBE7695062.1 DUF2520 domain-containing protein [Tenacibaculum finnmarkense genomovar finnmarkense]MCD8413527.1 DUF2520 domain-containing protein [Tenacibaculum finnmarkense genomovar ulcerans]MCD8427315.1 DUF2520 domain-containing protein [Tenacibaculum finnmarkense genomovar finnmarkense]MCG8208266.1 DUF2520 domain-containing protei
MIRIVIIGGGNVALHLASAFCKTKEISLVQMYARNIQQISHLKKQVAITDNLNLLAAADLYIIAVSDDAISGVSSKINKQNSLVVHTSGSVSLHSLQNNGRKGVFYLLQSFSKDKEINFDEIPFCLEAQNNDDFKLLESVAKSIGKKIYPISSKQRKTLHVAAVFVNNFTNHLYKIGDDICKEHRVPFEILHPLIEETAKKIQELSPTEAQTGPAKRNDKKTIQNHLELLDKEQQDIYQLITKSIQKTT